jgi:hypothetical protein
MPCGARALACSVHTRVNEFGVSTIADAARMSAMSLSFLCTKILKHICSIVPSGMLRRWYTHLEGQRSHECERGTHECVRHKHKNNRTRRSNGPISAAFWPPPTSC